MLHRLYHPYLLISLCESHHSGGTTCNEASCEAWFIEGPRYKCMDCPGTLLLSSTPSHIHIQSEEDWDYCENCFRQHKNSHNQTHRFLVLPYPTPRFIVYRLLSCFLQEPESERIKEWMSVPIGSRGEEESSGMSIHSALMIILTR